jgi:hypothetical protein
LKKGKTQTEKPDHKGGQFCWQPTPMQTFLDTLPLAKAKMLGKNLKTAAWKQGGLSD